MSKPPVGVLVKLLLLWCVHTVCLYHRHCCAFSNCPRSLSPLGIVEVGAPLQLVSIDSGWQTTPVVIDAWDVGH